MTCFLLQTPSPYGVAYGLLRTDPFPLRGANGLRRTGTVLPSLRHGWIFNPSSYGPCYAPNLGEEFEYSSFPVLPSFRGLKLRQSEYASSTIVCTPKRSVTPALLHS